MPNNNPESKGGFGKGNSNNPGGMRKGMRKDANDFRDWAFSVWKDNRKVLAKSILDNDISKMNFLKMLASFVPKEVDLGNQGESILNIRIVKE